MAGAKIHINELVQQLEKLDDGIASVFTNRKITYSSLNDGNHTSEVCNNGPQGLSRASYNWIVDTISPTAFVTASTFFTSSLNVSVNISLSKSCMGGGGFGCKFVNACNLLVYVAGEVTQSSIRILQLNLRNHIPEKLLQFNSETRAVHATNDYNKLKVYVYFSVLVLNSSTETINFLNISKGSLRPTSAESLGERGFKLLIANISFNNAIILVDFNLESIISRQETQVSPVAQVTFLYDSNRPSVMLSTYSRRTKEHNLHILIKFVKPVFGFNTSYISILGGLLKSFHEIKWRTYIIELQAYDDLVFVNVPENVTSDVAGNKNLVSNVLQVRHYYVPLFSSVISTVATASSVYGSPLTPLEYQQYFESLTMKPETDYILDSQHSSGWTNFYRSKFWLAVICGGLMALHAFPLIILKFWKRNTEKHRIYRALTFSRFEISLVFLALPSICKASSVLIREVAPSAMAVGILLLKVPKLFLMLPWKLLGVAKQSTD